jgi:hypothetical protein
LLYLKDRARKIRGREYLKHFLYRVGKNQLDNLNLAPCRHLCRWRSETHIEQFEAFSHHASLVERKSIKRLQWKRFLKTKLPLRWGQNQLDD